jgi:hypothetical protein
MGQLEGLLKGAALALDDATLDRRPQPERAAG